MTDTADIVIVNWNSGNMLWECLASVAATQTGVGRVIVVDNGSTDASLNLRKVASLGFEVIETGANFGFAKACNIGAARCSAPFILFLNPDARLIADGLAQAVGFLSSAPGRQFGICGVRLIGRTGQVERHCAHFTDASTYVAHAMGLANKFPSLFTPHFMIDFDHLQSRPVDQVIGAFFLVRRLLFEELNGFDERYFMYFEEVDFSLRAKHVGWGTYYLASATGYHYGGGASENVKAKRLFYSLRSRLLYARRHFSILNMFVTYAVTLLIEPISRVVQAVLKRSAQDAGNVLHAYALLIQDLAGIRQRQDERRIGK